MRLMIEHTLPTAPSQELPSSRVLELAAMFGLGVDEQQSIPIIPRCEIPLPDRGGIVFITGPSGSGKSTIVRLIAEQCRQRSASVLMLHQLPPPPEVPLVDALGQSLEQAVSLLSMVGLGDAFVMLRTPSQLSDGQRARFTIARAMEWAETSAEPVTQGLPRIIIADEFAATLDRLTAQTLARSIRRDRSHASRVRCRDDS